MFRFTTPFNPNTLTLSASDPAIARGRPKTRRKALLTSVAAGAMMISYSQIVQAQEVPTTTDPNAPCYSDDGTFVTCTGDVSAGIRIHNANDGTSYTTLNINNVAGPITPATNVGGISFASETGDVTIIGDEANPFNIKTNGATTTGQTVSGIEAVTSNGYAINVEHWGDIETNGIGAKGILAHSHGGGAVTVTHTGDIRTNETWSVGIEAYGWDGGAVSVTYTGVIETEGDTASAIDARSVTTSGGDVTVVMVGDAEVKGSGLSTDNIYARAEGDGDASITHIGNATNGSTGTQADGLDAISGGAITVNHSGGTIDVAGRDGIRTQSAGGNIAITLGAESIALDGSTVSGSRIISRARVGVRFVNGATNMLTIYNEVAVSGNT